MGAVARGERGIKLQLGGDFIDLTVQFPVQFPQELGGGAPAPGVLLEMGRTIERLGRR